MSVIRSFFMAFSIYSKIPVPQFRWEERDMKYAFCFFPWVGAAIGLCVYGWNWLCSRYGVGIVCRVFVDGALPLLITGGFHVDGFMDSMDAFCSYQPKERKLEILKDPHIGAFAVIMLAAYGLIYLGAFSEIRDMAMMKIACAGFFLARCLSGIGAVSFPLAKGDGMLYVFADNSHKRIVRWSLYLQCSGCVIWMVRVSAAGGIGAAAAALAAFWWYYRKCMRQLGGITGDTAGYFVLICELWVAVTAAFIGRVS